jgi:hypothetical protein
VKSSGGQHDSQPANKQGGWPAPGNSGPNGWWNTSYQYRSTFGVANNEPPRLTGDLAPILAD